LRFLLCLALFLSVATVTICAVKAPGQPSAQSYSDSLKLFAAAWDAFNSRSEATLLKAVASKLEVVKAQDGRYGIAFPVTQPFLIEVRVVSSTDEKKELMAPIVWDIARHQTLSDPLLREVMPISGETSKLESGVALVRLINLDSRTRLGPLRLPMKEAKPARVDG
jgi:hypothetical protein